MATMKGKGILSEGIWVGLLGASAVAVWFLVVDLLSGAPLRTPGALGSALFLGAGAPEDVVVNATTVGLYTLVHGAVFLVLGIALAALARAADRTPSVLAGAILIIPVLEVLFVGAVAIVAEFLLGLLAWWAVLGGNVVASVAMGWMLWNRHPESARRLTSSDPLGTS